MSLKQKILDDLKACLKKQDKKRLNTLRLLQSAIKNKEIELRPNDIKDEDVLSVIKKQSKQVQESLDCYKLAGYKEQTEQEQYNLAVLKSYLPEELSKQKIVAIVQEAIKESGAQSLKDMGAVMKIAMSKSKGAIDGKFLSQTVREHLQKI